MDNWKDIIIDTLLILGVMVLGMFGFVLLLAATLIISTLAVLLSPLIILFLHFKK